MASEAQPMTPIAVAAPALAAAQPLGEQPGDDRPMPCIAIMPVEYRPSTWPRTSALVCADQPLLQRQARRVTRPRRGSRAGEPARQRGTQEEQHVGHGEEEPQRLDQPGARRAGQYPADEDVAGEHPGRGDGHQVARRVPAERDEQRLAPHDEAVGHAPGEEQRAEQRRAEQHPVDLMRAGGHPLAGRPAAGGRRRPGRRRRRRPRPPRRPPGTARTSSGRQAAGPPSPYPATCMPPTAMLMVARPKT